MSTTPPLTSSPVRNEMKITQKAIMGVREEKLHLTCRLEKFDKLRKCGALISAQTFQVDIGDSIGLPTTWQFYLQQRPVGHHDPHPSRSQKMFIGAVFELLKVPEGVEGVYASFDILINKTNGEAFFDEGDDFREMEVESYFEFRTMIEVKEDLTDVIQEDGSLIMELDIALLSKIVPGEHFAGKLKAFEVQSIQQLSKDMRSLVTMSGVKADASTSIISKDGGEFPVNRGVLAARSPVFQRMFQAEMTEALTGLVNIKDLSGKTVHVLLVYLCTGTLHQDWKAPEVIEELTSAAHKYELHLLTAFLDGVLGSLCTKDNALRLAILARTLGMKKAEKELFAYVKKHATSVEDFMVEPRNSENCAEAAE